MGGIQVIFVLLESRFKFVGILVVSLFVNWVVSPLPGVSYPMFEQKELLYFGSNIFVWIFLKWMCGDRYLDGVLNVLY